MTQWMMSSMFFRCREKFRGAFSQVREGEKGGGKMGNFFPKAREKKGKKRTRRGKNINKIKLYKILFYRHILVLPNPNSSTNTTNNGLQPLFHPAQEPRQV